MSQVDFEIWLNHFEHHARHPRCVPHGVSDLLKPHELRLIASSLATFQLGEQSEGRRLSQAARHFAGRRSIPALVRITELFIREEQRHAALLRAFMEDHHIPLKRTDWTDRVFRFVRRLAGFELYLHILISAELIGIVYYRALEAATDCQRLMVLCRVLVADELAHVGFESQLLLTVRAGRANTVQALMRSAHRAFLAGAASIVWLTHRSNDPGRKFFHSGIIECKRQGAVAGRTCEIGHLRDVACGDDRSPSTLKYISRKLSANAGRTAGDEPNGAACVAHASTSDAMHFIGQACPCSQAPPLQRL